MKTREKLTRTTFSLLLGDFRVLVGAAVNRASFPANVKSPLNGQL